MCVWQLVYLKVNTLVYCHMVVMVDGRGRGAVVVCLLSAVAGVSSQACEGQFN